jgi:hypothetical protein
MYPTISSPWYVIYRLEPVLNVIGPTDGQIYEVSYYVASQEGSDHIFSTKKMEAQVFDNMIAAARVASIEMAEIRALTRREEAMEFNAEVSKETNRR